MRPPVEGPYKPAPGIPWLTIVALVALAWAFSLALGAL
jgi:hypothetical protein